MVLKLSSQENPQRTKQKFQEQNTEPKWFQKCDLELVLVQ